MRFAVVPALSALVAVAGAWSCVASEAPDLPPPIGAPKDGALPDVPLGPDISAPCPGHGSVTVEFDRGKATETCWSGYSPLANPGGVLRVGDAIVSVNGSLTSNPGLSVGISLFGGSVPGKCVLEAGAKLALGGPCVLVSVAYETASGASEWRAFGGTGTASPTLAGSSSGSAVGTLEVGEYGTTLGDAVSVTFAPGAAVVLDTPDHPLVPISGSVSVVIQ